MGSKKACVVVALSVIGLAMGVLAGCTSSPPVGEVPSSVGYVEPAWMAEVRQDIERFDTALAGCMAEAGWEIVYAPDGDYGQSVEGLAPEQMDLFNDAHSVCVNKLVDSTDPLTEDQWRLRYSRALDTRDCLEAEGYDISDPPSEEVWVEQGLDGTGPLWVPFDEVIVQGMSGEVEMDQETYYVLWAKCPQAGPTSMGPW